MGLKIFLISFTLISILTCCSKSKKQTLDIERVQEEKSRSEIVDFSSGDIFQGEKKNEIRRVEPANPPVILDISGKIESKQLHINSFYKNSYFIKLKHPRSNEGKDFKINSNRYSSEKSSPLAMTILAAGVPRVTFLSVVIYKTWILVGSLSGLFCYNKDGEYLYTLLECDEFKDIDVSKYLKINMDEVNQVLCGFSVMDDICAFVSDTQGKATLHFFDLNNGTEIHRKTMPINNLYLLDGNHKTWLNYRYEVRAQEPLPYMCTLTANNDTICRFYNKNIFTDMTGMSVFHNPGSPNIYNYRDKLFVHQQGNDTIYRFRSEYEINPAYVFKTGDYRATIQDIIKGNIKEKRSIDKIIETDKLLMFSLKGSDKILFYDKAIRKIYESDSNFFNSSVNILPSTFDMIQGNEQKLYDVCTKQTLSNFMANKEEKERYSAENIEFINKWKDEVGEGEILLMLLE